MRWPVAQTNDPFRAVPQVLINVPRSQGAVCLIVRARRSGHTFLQLAYRRRNCILVLLSIARSSLLTPQPQPVVVALTVAVCHCRISADRLDRI